MTSYARSDCYSRLNVIGRGLLLGTALAGFAAPVAAQSTAPDPLAGPNSSTQVTPSVPTTAVDAAQSAANPNVPGFGQNEIVVTALKRGTRIQETPISISAVTSQALANSGIQNIADLRSQVPSLNFVDAGPSNLRVVIRGIYASGEPTVGVYYDETPVTGTVGASNDAGGSTPELRLFDVERVEVLRGPQGTLYGSGSMGGTLRVIYKKPIDKFEAAFDGSLSGTQHGGANEEVNAAVNVPIVTDKVAIRAVGYYRENAGYIDNTYLHINNINSLDSYGGRIMVRLTPVERLTVDLAAYLSHVSTDTPSWIAEAGEYKTDARVRLPIRDDVKLYNATGQYDFGGVIATGVVSYMDRHLATTGDTSRYIQGTNNLATYNRLCAAGCRDQNNVPITSFAGYQAYVAPQTTSNLYPQQTLNALTGEARLSSSGHGALNWTVGAFYSRRRTDVFNPQVNSDPISGQMIYPLQVDTGRYIHDALEQKAVFADVSLDITPKLNVTVGGRYFKYKREITGHTDVPSILVGARITPLTTSQSSEHGQVFKANASYKITPDVMVYANFAQGFRPGGVNQVLGLASTLTPYQSDKLNNYEIGLKTSSFDRKVTLNVDVFQIDWKNMQVTGQTPNGAFSFITNAGASRIRGVELDTGITPVHGLNISGNLSYLDAKLSENQANSQVLASGLKGDRIPFVPKWTGGASAQYTFPLFGGVNGLVRGDYSYVGASYSDFRQTARYTRRIDSYSLVNARIGIESVGDSGWGAYIYGTNLFDSTAIVRASSSAIGVGLTSVTSAMPRTIGLNLRKNF